MSESVKNVLVGVAIFIEYKWPDFYEKYLR